VEAAKKANKALLICTTGHDAPTRAAIDAAAKDIAVMVAPNTSLGVAVLNAALALALEALGPDFAAEIVEMHHDKKKDAPSGTAIRLTDTIQRARDNSVVTTGRVGPRKTEEIGVFAVRGGNVIGEHTVYLIGEHERIELSHRAHSRDLFAAGALRAASWLVGQPAGAYTIEDSLNLGRKRS
jgi:4-hydroxy-tetrahydrodipicolinate reductase